MGTSDPDVPERLSGLRDRKIEVIEEAEEEDSPTKQNIIKPPHIDPRLSSFDRHSSEYDWNNPQGMR